LASFLKMENENFLEHFQVLYISVLHLYVLYIRRSVLFFTQYQESGFA